MPDAVEVRGYCDERFSSVKEAFAQNFEEGLEVGASFAATIPLPRSEKRTAQIAIRAHNRDMMTSSVISPLEA